MQKDEKKPDAFLCGDILLSRVVMSDTEEEKLSYGDGAPGGVSERPLSQEPLQQENFRRTVTTMHGFLKQFVCKRQFLYFPPHQTSVVSHFEKADSPAAEAPMGGGAYLELVRRVCSRQASSFAWAGRTDGSTAGSEEATTGHRKE